MMTLAPALHVHHNLTWQADLHVIAKGSQTVLEVYTIAGPMQGQTHDQLQEMQIFSITLSL